MLHVLRWQILCLQDRVQAELIYQKKDLHIYPSIDETRKSNLKKYFQREFLGFNEAKDSVFAYKMDEQAFVQYFKKELKSDPIQLKRLK